MLTENNNIYPTEKRKTTESQTDLVTVLREEIENSPKRIQDELARSENPWSSCFNTRIFVISVNLYLIKEEGLLASETIQNMQDKIKDIRDRADSIKNEYGWSSPPEQVKTELLGMIKDLLLILDQNTQV